MARKKKYKATGCHVFAGGFTMGVRQVMEVEAQLEIHNFGRETVEQKVGIDFVNRKRWDEWPVLDTHLLYGNPRCTGFSCVTAGYSKDIHGPYATCTQDIRDLCSYGVHTGVPIIIWESVQQAWTVGKPLLDDITNQIFAPNDYRVAHVFVNAASMGNAQSRKRYFFVGYRGDKNFNITPPTLPEYQTTVGDIIGLFKDYPVREVNYNRRDSEYQPDDYIRLAPEDKKILPGLLQGESMNVMGRRGGLVGFSDKLAKKWVDRLSDMPFSMHCPLRIRWDGHCPTMSSSCSQYIHPLLDRPLTVRELSALMGWTDGITPAGPLPTAQIAKGICPEVGVWLAEQAVAYLDDAWGRDDWSSSWNHKIGQWEGYEYDDRPLEKVFNLTNFAPERRQALCTTA